MGVVCWINDKHTDMPDLEPEKGQGDALIKISNPPHPEMNFLLLGVRV